MEPSILYFDTVAELATYSNESAIFKDNKENAAFSKSDHETSLEWITNIWLKSFK